jgi:hypothetical protein
MLIMAFVSPTGTHRTGFEEEIWAPIVIFRVLNLQSPALAV